MKETLIVGGFILLFIGIISAGIASSIYSYHECLHVGHAKLYCILHFGR